MEDLSLEFNKTKAELNAHFALIQIMVDHIKVSKDRLEVLNAQLVDLQQKMKEVK